MTMFTITRGLVAGIVLAGAAVGLASPASADDPLIGDYTSTLVGSGRSAVATFTECGPDCRHFVNGNPPYDLHRQGTTWVGTYPGNDGTPINVTIDSNTLAQTNTVGTGTFSVAYQLTKNG